MDRKSLIIFALCFLLLLLWTPLVNRIYPPVPLPATNQVTGVQGVTNGTDKGEATAVDAVAGADPARGAVTAPAPVPAPAESEEVLVLEDELARYVFTSYGGGIKEIELKKYDATVDCEKATAEKLATLNEDAPVPAMALASGSAGLFRADDVYALERIEGGVRAQKQLPGGLVITKEFRLSTNYLLNASARIENQSSGPVNLPDLEWVIGTATPIGNRDESMYLGLQWFNGKKSPEINQAWFENRTLGCFPGTPRTLFLEGNSNVVWAAVNNRFFTIIAVPERPAPGVAGKQVPLPMPTAAEIAEDSQVMRQPMGYQTSFIYPGVTLGSQESVVWNFKLFGGPKEYNTLAKLGHDMDRVMGFGGFFGFFAKALLLSMNGLHAMGLSYGLSIIGITIIIKLIFWPLTTASTRSMKRMAALQPQMKAIQEKYKEDPRKMQMKLMQFMKENRVSPLGGCIPMLIQIPVFIGFFQMLRSAIELRGAQFLWACDLSQPDTVFYLLGFPVNPLPILMGATMLWQSHMTPPAPGVDPVQQKIMKYMPMIFVVFLYNFSAGLTLYWTVQNLLTIAQMKLTKANVPGTPGVPAAVQPAKEIAPKKKKKQE